MLNPCRLALIAGSFLASVVPLTAAQQPQPPTAPAPAAQTPPANVPFVPASTPEQEQLRFVPAKRYGGQVHLLPATLETTQWGWFNNAQPPVLHVNSGDTIVFETMMHSHNQVVPGATIEQIKKLRTDFPGRGPHTLTGPVYIEGAEPGDVLKVRINRIVPRAYGTNFNVPGMFGQFPGKFPEGQVKYFYLDLERKIAEFAPGIEIPLAPFPGILGVARAESGQYSSVPPGRYGGNLDIRDMTEGAALYVPVVQGNERHRGGAQGYQARVAAHRDQEFLDHRRHRPGAQQGARETQDGNDCISDGAAQDREGPGGKADARFMGLPREPGGRREQGTALLQRQESERAAQGRGAAGTGKQDLPCHRRQGCRSQQGDG
ncbi:MAG: hypothetical protein E6H64_13815 [Betaproteobacteria bacterium]|nr:MAG: hypothetical protein E6H64_13815 [Betaproteobacteria bacterium]